MMIEPGRIGSFSFDRRRLLHCVVPSLFGLSAAASAAPSGHSQRTAARSVLVVYEEGGMSQMDTWDPKPDAPVDHRSPYKPISTTVPGIQVTSLMPNLARHVDKLSIVRSMTTARVAGHMEGCREFFKGYRFDSTVKFPDIGSVAVELLGTDCPQLPGYVFAPGANMPNHVSNSGFLKADRAPWKLGTKSLGENVAAPDWRVKALDPQPELNAERLASRRGLLASINDFPIAGLAAAEQRNSYMANAFDMLTNPQVQSALSFRGESEATLDRYGRDHRGLCYLLGRKLIEAGVRFVSVTVIQPPDLVGRPNYGEPNGVFLNWDHHEGIYRDGPCGGPQGMSNQERYGLPHPIMMPSFDRSFSALLDDLYQRGLLDETLVCYVTEMGRTPRVNKWGGRDHWARAMSIAFAGAGVPGGQIIGRTDREAADVVDARYTPYDFAATIYRKLGIDADCRLKLADGRPIDLTDGGRPIPELF